MIYSAVSVAVANEKDRRRNEATAPRAEKKGKKEKSLSRGRFHSCGFCFKMFC
jgi:hypothetical protein